MASGRGGNGEESAPKRASVFSRLGTKGTLGGSKSSVAGAGASNSGANQAGVSASGGAGSSKKRDSAGGPGQRKNYLLGHRSGPNEDSPTIDPNWENWDEKNLDHDDEYMLEKKRQLLKKELGELVTPVDPEAGGSGAQAQVPVIPATARPSARSPVKRKRVGGPPAKLTRAPVRRSSSSSSSGSSSSSSSGSSSSGSSSDSGRAPRKKQPRKTSHLIRSPSHSSPERVKGSKRIKSGKRHKLAKKVTKSVVKGAKGGKSRAVNSSPKRGPQEKKARGSDGKIAASQSATAIAPPKVRQEPDKFGFYCTQAPAAVVEPIKLSSDNKSSSTKESRSKAHSQVLKRRGTPRVISASTTASSNLSPKRVSSAPLKDRRNKSSASLPQGKLSDPSSPGRHDKRSPSMDRRRGGPHHDRGLSPLTSSNTRLRSRSPRMGMSSRRASRSPLMDSDRRGESFEDNRMMRDFSPRAGRSREDHAQFSRGSSAPRHYRNASPLRRDPSRPALRASRDRSPMVGGAGLKRGARDARQPQLRDESRYGRGGSPDDRDFRDFDRRSASRGARGLYDDRELRDADPRDLRRDINVKGERRFEEGRGLNQGRGFPRGAGGAGGGGGGGGGGSNRVDETWDDRSFRDARDDRRFNESRPPTQSGRGVGLGSGVRDSWNREEGRDWPDESPGWRDRTGNPGGRGGGRKQGGGGRSSDRGGNSRGMLSRSSERGRGNNDKSAAQLTGANSVRVAQPRGREMDWSARRRSPPVIELQRGLARDHRSQSNERLLPLEALARGSRERSISRDRTSAPRTLLALSEGPRKRSQSREMSRPKDLIQSRPASVDRLDSQSELVESGESVSKKRSLEEEGEVDEEVPPSAKKVKLNVPGTSDAELSSQADEDESSRTAKTDMPPIPASPKPLVDENAEDISDIGDSDDEILNKDPILDPSPEVKLEPALEAGELTPIDEERPTLESRSTPTRNPGDKKGESKLECVDKGPESPHSNEDKMDNDLLEGISDEDLALSDEDEIKTKAKIADALGADWSELMSRPEEKAPGSTSLRDKWSLLSIAKSVGISKNLLGPEKYAKFLEKVNKDVPESEQFKPVSDLAGLDVTRRRNALEFNQLYAHLKPYGEGLTGLKDRAIRRRIQGYLPLPPSETPSLKTSSEWHEAALKLLRDKMAPVVHP